MEPAGWSVCMTVMRGRSPRAGWGNRSSSVTRGRSSTTTTASSWITPSSRAIHPTRRNWLPRCSGSPNRAGRTPGTVTADRGYGETKVDNQLTELGVKNVVIPRRGKPTQARRAEEHRKAFRRTVKWRTGSEGRISHLKRGFGWDRTRIDGTEGARIWAGHGVLAHNLVKISALAGQRATHAESPASTTVSDTSTRSQHRYFFRSKYPRSAPRGWAKPGRRHSLPETQMAIGVVQVHVG